MLTKVLIANRGEIAIRIARTASAIGIGTVAIYSPDDARSLHIKHTDQAFELPGAGVSAYLNIDSIIDIAKACGCDAVHPGYGLLSERADFAAACADNGLIFIGPDVDTLQANGDKVSARALARRAKVPVIEGVDGIQTAEDVAAFFAAQGCAPIIVKAVNGGGGRGMRIVRAESEIASAFTQCQAEALSAFGEDALYAERFLPSVRHIEVQIVGDGKEVIHLWERDCSIQRRNQKILELAPAPNLAPALRQKLLSAAVAIGKACHYKGLGTVEFLVETTTTASSGSDSSGNSGNFFFIETNPRIQVEHTITEEITGRDLVEIQLRIASGESLSDMGLTQDGIPAPNGYALQARVNTETLNAQGEIVPSGGTLTAFNPPGGRGVRVDTYGYQGYRTNPNFDSLLAKLIVHSTADSLSVLLGKTERALSEFHIGGIDTNIGFLRSLLKLPELQAWTVSVKSIEAQLKDLSDKTVDGGRYFDEILTIDNGGSALEEDYPTGSSPICAPMQAMVVDIQVKEGDVVEAGAELGVIEAMKMQHVITAPSAGQVLRIMTKAGDLVGAHQALLLFEEHDGGESAQGAHETFDLDTIRPDLQALRERIALTLDDTRPKAIERRRSRGQRTTRENIAQLVDDGSFIEYGQLVYAGQRRKRDKDELMKATPADGIVTGIGSVNGEWFGDASAQTAVLAYDSTVLAGTQGLMGHKKTDRMLETVHEQKLPVIFYTEGGGGRPGDEDFDNIQRSSLDIKTFNIMARLHGRGPKIAVNSGYCFAGNAAMFGLCDIKIANRNSWIGMGGPAMIEAGGLGACSPQDVGPAPMQAKIGLIDLLADSDDEATALAKQTLSYFQGQVTHWEAEDQRLLRHAIPENRKRVYDIRKLIQTLVDQTTFLELKPDYAPGMITALCRIEGIPLALIANNPGHLGGAIDAAAADKVARFLNLCNKFRLPVLSLCDTPGFMVGPENERQGSVEKAAAIMEAGANLQSPLFFVCLRKGYGLGAQGMAGGSFSAPVFSISWPTGEFGPMGLEGGVELGYKRELDATTSPEERDALFKQLVDKAYQDGSAVNIASLLEIDAVIDPQETRDWIVRGMRAASVASKNK